MLDYVKSFLIISTMTIEWQSKLVCHFNFNSLEFEDTYFKSKLMLLHHYNISIILLCSSYQFFFFLVLYIYPYSLYQHCTTTYFYYLTEVIKIIVDFLPLNVFGMSYVVSLGFFISVVHYRNSCYKIQKFSGGENPQISSRICPSITITITG